MDPLIIDLFIYVTGKMFKKPFKSLNLGAKSLGISLVILQCTRGPTGFIDPLSVQCSEGGIDNLSVTQLSGPETGKQRSSRTPQSSAPTFTITSNHVIDLHS